MNLSFELVWCPKQVKNTSNRHVFIIVYPFIIQQESGIESYKNNVHFFEKELIPSSSSFSILLGGPISLARRAKYQLRAAWREINIRHTREIQLFGFPSFLSCSGKAIEWVISHPTRLMYPNDCYLYNCRTTVDLVGESVMLFGIIRTMSIKYSVFLKASDSTYRI